MLSTLTSLSLSSPNFSPELQIRESSVIIAPWYLKYNLLSTQIILSPIPATQLPKAEVWEPCLTPPSYPVFTPVPTVATLLPTTYTLMLSLETARASQDCSACLQPCPVWSSPHTAARHLSNRQIGSIIKYEESYSGILRRIHRAWVKHQHMNWDVWHFTVQTITGA